MGKELDNLGLNYLVTRLQNLLAAIGRSLFGDQRLMIDSLPALLGPRELGGVLQISFLHKDSRVET